MSDHATTTGPGYQVPEDMTLFVLIIPVMLSITLIVTVVSAILIF
jgi:hypothetical protein